MLEFDHREGETKLFCISRSNGVGMRALQDEIAKCDIVCANCHASRTYMRLVKNMPMMEDLDGWYKDTT